MADTCLLSLPSLFTTTPTTSSTAKPSLSLPSKPKHPTSLLFSVSHPSLSFKLKPKQPHFRNFTAFVSQTSDWGQQDEDSNSVVTVSESEEESAWGNEGGFSAGTETETVAEGFEFGGVEESEDVGGSEGIGEESDGFVEPPEEAKIFIGNLPYDVDSEKLAMLFEQAGTVEIAEVIYNRETDSSRGFGFVTMSTVEDAEKAVNMFDGYDMQGRLLTVNKAAPRGARPERRPRVSQPGYRIYVGNLPWEVDNARLEQVFSEHGKVVEARVVYERESGRSRGFGFVTMSSETELNDAIAALDGQSLDGRAIRVNMAEERPRRF